MGVELLADADVARWREAPFTYEAVGATAGSPPQGFHHVVRTRTLPEGADFDEVAGRLMAWQLQARAGLRVRASGPVVVPDAVVVLRLGVGRLGVSAPCRVVYVVDEPGRRGFAYGTLPGHAESGEERFLLERRADGRVELEVCAFSRPASRLARMGGPVATGVQGLITTRYLRALDG